MPTYELSLLLRQMSKVNSSSTVKLTTFYQNHKKPFFHNLKKLNTNNNICLPFAARPDPDPEANGRIHLRQGWSYPKIGQSGIPRDTVQNQRTRTSAQDGHIFSVQIRCAAQLINQHQRGMRQRCGHRSPEYFQD